MKNALTQLFEYRHLSKEAARDLLQRIGEGAFNDAQLASFMTVYLMRGISVGEILGFREALLAMCTKMDSLRAIGDPIDIVGTGGDLKNTFNISTAACFVVAGAGQKVVKHGNFAASSVSGASNVLQGSGVRFHADAGRHERSLEESNMAFLHAPLFHPALKNVAGVRQALGIRTFFNLLGPIVNPAQPRKQMLGVYDLKMARLYHHIYEQAGVDFAIVHTLDGYDEISLTDTVKIIGNRGETLASPEALGFRRLRPEALHAGASAEDALRIFHRLLAGEGTDAQKDVVLANAAVALRLCNSKRSLPEAVAAARESLESGAARRAFEKFRALNE